MNRVHIEAHFVFINKPSTTASSCCEGKSAVSGNHFSFFFKKNLNASRPSEHPPVRGENVKTFLRTRWDHRLQIQNLFIAFIRVPRWYDGGSNIGSAGRRKKRIIGPGRARRKMNRVHI